MARKLATAAICFTGSGTAFQSFRYLCASKAYLTYFSYSLSFCDHYSITCPDSLLKIRGKVDNLVICILFKHYKKTSSGFYSPYQSYSGSFPNVRSPVECVDEKMTAFVGILCTCQPIHAQLPANSKFWTGDDNCTNGAMSKLWITWLHE